MLGGLGPLYGTWDGMQDIVHVLVIGSDARAHVGAGGTRGEGVAHSLLWVGMSGASCY
jgi:hypothetical protein